MRKQFLPFNARYEALPPKRFPPKIGRQLRLIPITSQAMNSFIPIGEACCIKFTLSERLNAIVLQSGVSLSILHFNRASMSLHVNS